MNRSALEFKLHVQRSELCRALFGLQDRDFEIPLWDAYSIRLILTHIARWEEFEAERLVHLTAGEINRLVWTPVDERNAEWLETDRGLSLVDAIARLGESRSTFLGALDKAPTNLLKATVTLADDFELPVVSCVSNTSTHDEVHAGDIRAWRAENDKQKSQSGPSSILNLWLTSNQEAAYHLMRLIDQRSIHIDRWSPQQVLCHTAGWDDNMVKSLLGGIDLTLGIDIDEANASFAAQADQESVSDTLARLEASKEKTLAYLASVSDSAMHAPFESDIQRVTSRYDWIGFHAAHALDHLQEIYTAYLLQSRVKKKSSN